MSIGRICCLGKCHSLEFQLGEYLLVEYHWTACRLTVCTFRSNMWFRWLPFVWMPIGRMLFSHIFIDRMPFECAASVPLRKWKPTTETSAKIRFNWLQRRNLRFAYQNADWSNVSLGQMPYANCFEYWMVECRLTGYVVWLNTVYGNVDWSNIFWSNTIWPNAE